MLNKSIVDIRQAIRQHSNTERATGSITNAEIDDRIRDSLRGLYDRIINVHESYYLKSSPTFSLVGGVGGNTRTLETDFYKLKSVDKSPDTGSVRDVPALPSHRERNDGALRHDLIDNTTLAILPPQTAAGTYRYNYYPLPPVLLDPVITVQAGDSVNAASKLWTFQNYTFDSSWLGQSLTISGAANPGNNGTFTIGAASGHTLLTLPGPLLVDETFTATVQASTTQPSGTSYRLDNIMQPWSLILELEPAIAVLIKREMDPSGLLARLAREDQRLASSVRSRREEPLQVPLARGRYDWDWRY